MAALAALLVHALVLTPAAFLAPAVGTAVPSPVEHAIEIDLANTSEPVAAPAPPAASPAAKVDPPALASLQSGKRPASQSADRDAGEPAPGTTAGAPESAESLTAN